MHKNLNKCAAQVCLFNPPLISIFPIDSILYQLFAVLFLFQNKYTNIRAYIDVSHNDDVNPQLKFRPAADASRRHRRIKERAITQDDDSWGAGRGVGEPLLWLCERSG